MILKGRTTKDTELRTTTSGKSVAQVTLAVNRYGKAQEADFIPLVIWGKTAENFARYIGKGREVLVEGSIQVRSYDDRNGNKRYVTEVIVQNFEFCGSANRNENQQDNTDSGYFGAAGFSGQNYDEEIPF